MSTESTPATPATPPPTSTESPSGGFMTPAATTPPTSGDSPPPSTFFGEHIVSKEGKFQEGWTESLQKAGFERLATKAAMAPDEPTLFRSIDEALGLIGKKAAPAYPGADSSDADIAAFRSSAGIPDTPDAYNLKPEALPPGIQWNDDQAAELAATFHEHHVPEKTAQALVAKHMEALAGTASASTQAQAAKLQELSQLSDSTFRKEWGEAFESRLQANQDFISTRLSESDLSDPAILTALSHPEIVRLVDEARRQLREAPLPGVNAATGNTLSARQQAKEIIRANPNWERDPDLNRRVNDLYKLEAKQSRRQARS